MVVLDHASKLAQPRLFWQEYKYSIFVRDAPVGEDSTRLTSSTCGSTVSSIRSEASLSDAEMVQLGEVRPDEAGVVRVSYVDGHS